MPPTKKPIPFDDVVIRIKGLRTLVEKEGLSYEKIAEYYTNKLGVNVSEWTIKRRVAEMRKSNKRTGNDPDFDHAHELGYFAITQPLGRVTRKRDKK